MIFGSGSAKFVSGATTVNLEHSVLIPKYTIPEYVEKVDVINGNKTFLPKGDYSEFQLNVFLSKYDNPKDKFNEIYPYIYTDVFFYPHEDGKTLYDQTGSALECHITDMKLSYLEDLTYKDLLTITFESKGWIDITSSSLG